MLCLIPWPGTQIPKQGVWSNPHPPSPPPPCSASAQKKQKYYHDFFFAGLLFVSFHLTSVTSSFSFPSFDIFKENPFCTVIWEEEEINLAFTCLRKLQNLVETFPVIWFCFSPSSNHENMFWCFLPVCFGTVPRSPHSILPSQSH